jgi:hypothetical protein
MSFISTNNVTLIDNNTILVAEYVEKDSISQNRIPSKLRKTLWCTLSLFCVGFILLAVAIEEIIRTGELEYGWGYMAISVIVLIPGLFYLIMFIRAKREKNDELKRDLFGNIPEL